MLNLRSTMLVLAFAHTTFAQCVPAWDTAIGSPGITSDGYAGPMIAFNDGRGEALYIGGSFSSAGGYVTRGIARYDPANPDTNWSDVGGGCYSTQTNYFLAALTVHDFGSGPELVAGGSFATAGGTSASTNLARWNGQRWLGLGTPNGAIWSLATFNGRLYAGGGFTSIGGVTVSGIASFDGTTWSSPGTGMAGGFSPGVFALKVFNDGTGQKLYAAGRLGSIGGVNGMIARWTGSAWQPIGAGITAVQTFSDIEAMAIHNDGTGDKLYVGGYDLRVGAVTTSVARWSGTSWSPVGQYLGGRTTALASFDDGGGSKLYNSGTAQPGINYIASLVSNQWTIVDGGVGQPGGPPWPSTFGLCTWQQKLYIGGDFDYVGTAQLPASGLVVRTSCICPADFNDDGILDFFDYLDFVSAFSAQSPTADFNLDSIIDFFDYLDFVQSFSTGC